MGMYTEFHFNVALVEGVDVNVVATLESMVSDSGIFLNAPEHKLFAKSRAIYMLRCDSYYFEADTLSTLRFDTIAECYYLNIKCNLKNYEGEIEAFIDWIDPYVDASIGNFLGFYRYEESTAPTLIFKK